VRTIRKHRPEIVILTVLLLIIAVAGMERFTFHRANLDSSSILSDSGVPTSLPYARTTTRKSASRTNRAAPAIGSGLNTRNDSSNQTTDSTAFVYVDVQGAVARPGVYRVRAQQRVMDVITMAGGFAKGSDPSGINGAALIQDGELVHVPFQTAQVGGQVASVSGANIGAVGHSLSAKAKKGTDFLTHPLNINTATVTQLQLLPGVGSKRAEQVVEYRTAHGMFQSIDDLAHVRGFGPKRLATLRRLTIAR